MLDTDQLRSFMAIVDTGSFTRAAERVHKTQSAVSMHIRRLEEQLGRRAVREKRPRRQDSPATASGWSSSRARCCGSKPRR